jgi:hypothetical protein
MIPVMTSSDLYTPSDAQRAYDTWGANCGPAALAALLRRPVMTVLRFLDGFEGRRFMNPTQMQQALHTAQQPFRVRRRLDPGVTYGLWFVQWEGPWTAPKVPARAAYPYTHWVGVAQTEDRGQMLYDVNAAPWGSWVPKRGWDRVVVPAITHEIPQATGAYFLRWACDVVQKEGRDALDA